MLGAMHKQCATHVPDAMHERTNELTYAEVSELTEKSNVSNARRRVGHIYIVRWTEARFTKVGVSLNESRWRSFVNRGGELLGVLTGPMPRATVIESEMHAALVRAGAIPAFLAKADAIPYLGSNGAGWTECYVDRTGREVLAHLIDWAYRRRDEVPEPTSTDEGRAAARALYEHVRRNKTEESR